MIKNAEIVAKDEVISLCKKDIAKKEEDIEILTEKIEELDSTLDKERQEAVVKVQELELKNVASTNKLRTEVILLNGKLEALEEFRVKKDEYLEKIQDLEEQLKIKDEDYEDAIYEMEKKSGAVKHR